MQISSHQRVIFDDQTCNSDIKLVNILLQTPCIVRVFLLRVLVSCLFVFCAHPVPSSSLQSPPAPSSPLQLPPGSLRRKLAHILVAHWQNSNMRKKTSKNRTKITASHFYNPSLPRHRPINHCKKCLTQKCNTRIAAYYSDVRSRTRLSQIITVIDILTVIDIFNSNRHFNSNRRAILRFSVITFSINILQLTCSYK